ncbi:MAG: hypothetical protein M1827_004122 [Pycnora praestabilis]|nr:MAG: hypothetical protein M1827_004122 [Pycnora praestabilis]
MESFSTSEKMYLGEGNVGHSLPTWKAAFDQLALLRNVRKFETEEALPEEYVQYLKKSVMGDGDGKVE